MSQTTDKSIKYYGYFASPYARKIVWYLTLRGLPYTEVKQPMIMPRPDLQAIGVAYRRIPIVVIGKDVYCDTRMILKKLEELFPEGSIGATTADGQALQKLLEIWHVEGPLFWKGAYSMPLNNFRDPNFSRDREQMTGRPWNIEQMSKQRPEALIYVRSAFSFLEKLLADGRSWILSTNKPTLADIEGLYVVHWLNQLDGALPKELISRTIFPKVFAWFDRFDDALRSARSQAPKPTKVDGTTAAKQIFASDFAETEGTLETAEPQQDLTKGDSVEVFPVDSGFNNKDRGKLLSLNEDEIVISLENGLRLHTPRAGFRVRKVVSKL